MIKPLMNSILSDDSVCGEFDCRNIFRSAKLETMGTSGASEETGRGLNFLIR